MQYLRRAASSNDRVTKGTLYRIRSDHRGEHIIDDNGDRMNPSKSRKYWVEVNSTSGSDNDTKETLHEYAERKIEEVNSQYEKGTIMIKIETVTLVNGDRADELSSNTIIDMITGEEVKVAHLTEVKTKLSLIAKIKGESKAINKIMDRHVETIITLVTILDSREED